MPSIRVVLRSSVLVEDASIVLKSVDELTRIFAWAETSGTPQRPLYRVVRRNATWRSIEGLLILQVRSGSELFDIGSEVIPAAAFVAVVGLFTDVFLNRSHRMNMNKIAEDSARHALEHQKEFDNLALAEKAISVEKQRRELLEQSNRDQRENFAVVVAKDYPLVLTEAQQVARDLDAERVLNEEIDLPAMSQAQLFSEGTDRTEYERRVGRAYIDAVRALNRLDQVQNIRQPIDSIGLLEE